MSSRSSLTALLTMVRWLVGCVEGGGHSLDEGWCGVTETDTIIAICPQTIPTIIFIGSRERRSWRLLTGHVEKRRDIVSQTEICGWVYSIVMTQFVTNLFEITLVEVVSDNSREQLGCYNFGTVESCWVQRIAFKHASLLRD
jgi:hypothetical protein